uniref:Purple acid phosphatase N-terminal domain-containing protein n=1 Tax=Timema bartmani TaxID=61472 RepID=A0A7R9F7E7_9NEOP|nr:unnamed protein product [Timema bartmani]
MYQRIRNNVSEIVVTWSTLQHVNKSVVEYGINGLILTESNDMVTRFNYGTFRHQYIHRVKLKNLTPGSKYVYHCGSDLGWSDLLWFNTPPTDTDYWRPSLAIFGDMGNENAQSLPRLQQETQRGLYDAIIHVGDFAYDMDSQGPADNLDIHTESRNVTSRDRQTISTFTLSHGTSPAGTGRQSRHSHEQCEIELRHCSAFVALSLLKKHFKMDDQL